jgi:hypothetical protein
MGDVSHVAQVHAILKGWIESTVNSVGVKNRSGDTGDRQREEVMIRNRV